MLTLPEGSGTTKTPAVTRLPGDQCRRHHRLVHLHGRADSSAGHLSPEALASGSMGRHRDEPRGTVRKDLRVKGIASTPQVAEKQRGEPWPVPCSALRSHGVCLNPALLSSLSSLHNGSHSLIATCCFEFEKHSMFCFYGN